MSKGMDIYAELDNFVMENEGEVLLTDVAKHFTDYGYQYAIDKACEWIAKIDVNDYLNIVPGFGHVIEDEDAIKDFRKAMEE